MIKEIFNFDERQHLIDETHKANSYLSREYVEQVINEAFPETLPCFTFEFTKNSKRACCVITGENNQKFTPSQLPILARNFYYKQIRRYL